MRVLFDTSLLIALFVENHPQHDKASKAYTTLVKENAEPFISAHSLAETFRTLTKGTRYLDFTAKQARKIIREAILPNFSIVSLQADGYMEVIDELANKNLTGAIIYDALISKAATIAEANYLVTFNVKDFQKVFPENGADLILPR